MIRPFISLCFLILFALSPSFAQSQETKALIQLDLGWEKALLTSDVAFLEKILDDEFVWVHNHAGLIDGKPEVIARAMRIKAGQTDDTKGRTSRDQSVVVRGETAVVSGYTVVDRGPSPVTYHFMRTYAKVNGEFKLLANHTMAIPDAELK